MVVKYSTIWKYGKYLPVVAFVFFAIKLVMQSSSYNERQNVTTDDLILYASRELSNLTSTDATVQVETKFPGRCPVKFNFSTTNTEKQIAFNHKSPYSEGIWNASLDKTVLILTPVNTASKHLENYFKLICSLSYPHHLISVVLGEDSSTDDTFEKARTLKNDLEGYFRRIDVINLGKTTKPQLSRESRHAQEQQLHRRVLLAEARNKLLFRALRDETYVLWLDADVGVIPEDLIQHLISANKPIVTCSCMYIDSSKRYQVYDRNTWRETQESLKFLEDKPEDYLMVEGYRPTQRRFLPDIINEGNVVELDGVGGCTLLIKSEAHKRGLIYPSFVFKHHIETEGLSKMAAAMGIPISGLPFVYVVHS